MYLVWHDGSIEMINTVSFYFPESSFQTTLKQIVWETQTWH